MRKILIFAGTTEGRELAKALSDKHILCIVSVATEYGLEVMPEYPYVEQRMGRMDVPQMVTLITEEAIDGVVDATHPFATEVTANIKAACEKSAVPYYRLRRNTDAKSRYEKVSWFADTSACEKALHDTVGNILLTTGSKELGIYCQDVAVRSRIYARVLPSLESIKLCNDAGLSGKQIIAMQGPFVEELNVALIKQFNIKIMVTKESGKTGGLDEKIEAANRCGVDLFVIGAPVEEDGLSQQELIKQLEIRD